MSCAFQLATANALGLSNRHKWSISAVFIVTQSDPYCKLRYALGLLNDSS